MEEESLRVRERERKGYRVERKTDSWLDVYKEIRKERKGRREEYRPMERGIEEFENKRREREVEKREN